MVTSEIIVKIYSDKKDFLPILPILRQVKIEESDIKLLAPRTIEIAPNDIIILLISKISSNWLNNFIKFRESLPNKFIAITRNDSAYLISSIVKLGFTDIFLFPHEIPKFIAHLEALIDNKSFLTTPHPDESKKYEFEDIIGTSPKFTSVVEIVKKVSENQNVGVLLLGETGTGKSLLAKAIHKSGKADNLPFVEIVCSAIPEDLLESELFGHEKGAFTNALHKKIGLFELAENGTLFLDEIGDLSLNIQVKLLRAIEKKIIRRLGGIEDIPIETRIISATNNNLSEMVNKNLFRSDLYHRLNVVSILLPPLRERENDVLLLTEKFIQEYNKQFGKSINTLEEELRKFLITYTWPGNVRELKNAVERAVLLSEDNILRVKDFEVLLQNIPLNLLEYDKHIKFHPNLIRLEMNYKKISLVKLSQLYAKEVLNKMGGNKFKSAQILGISRPKLDKLLSK